MVGRERREKLDAALVTRTGGRALAGEKGAARGASGRGSRWTEGVMEATAEGGGEHPSERTQTSVSEGAEPATPGSPVHGAPGGGEGGIRTHGAFAHRFSRAAPSTTRTPLRARGYQAGSRLPSEAVPNRQVVSGRKRLSTAPRPRRGGCR